MMNSVKIINTNITTSTGLLLLHGAFNYSWKNNITAEPIEGGYGNTEVLFNGWENPVMNLTFHIPLNSTYANGSTWLNWAQWNNLVKNQYDGTSATQTKLRLTVGETDTLFADYSSVATSTAVTDIPIVIKSYSLVFSPGESHNSNFWTINAQVQVTK